MSRLDDTSLEFQTLLAAACREDVTSEQLQKLERMANDPASMRLLVDYLQLDTELRCLVRRQTNVDKCLAMLGIETASGTPFHDGEEGESREDLPEDPCSSETDSDETPFVHGLVSFTRPSPSPQTSLAGAWEASRGLFQVGGLAFSYSVALVLVGVMLLGAWMYKVSHYRQIAVTPAPTSRNPSEMQFVGQITGMVDCRWSDPRTETYPGASAPLGRQYALSSGLMEITYDSGAKVILEGPCTYEVESPAGGFLSLGKLTAKVESGEWRVESAKLQAAKPQAPSPKPQDQNPKISKSPNLQINSPLSTLHSPLFSVRTPTAIVTDLGTEFGVEVNKDGDTTSHVFRGSARVQTVGNGTKKGLVLRANESARVEKNKKTGDVRIVTGGQVGVPPKFVRRLVEPPKLLDLLDIVAGGYGTGNRRERGIDPTTGREDTWYVPQQRFGDGQYRPISWHKLIDGVFLACSKAGPVRLDSAGHTFDGFPPSNAYTWGSIWARAADVESDLRAKDGAYWIYAMGRGAQFMPEGRGLLGIFANAGISFDLEAMRRTYPGAAPRKFRAVAGMADVRPLLPSAEAAADVWVFVDGRPKLQREKLRLQDGTLNVDVALGSSDRFLTLVVSKSSGKSTGNCIVFGDPVLEMALTEPEKQEEGRPMER